MRSDNAKLISVGLWVEKAEHDLQNAKHTLTMTHHCPFDTVCFHAQQCAEKYLKGLLVWLDIIFPKTHDLRLLFQLVPPNIDLKIELRELLRLNRYPIEARYPGDWEPIARAEAEQALNIARKVRLSVRKHLLIRRLSAKLKNYKH